ncbi:mitochondrial ATP synthase g subunit-domain-containing protein, partial [Infundibulicybe gibba]
QKAQQAQDTAARLWAQLQTLLAPVGQRAGQMLGSYRQPLLYNLAVAREVLKHIYVAEGLRPPTLAAVRAAYETMWTRGSSPAYWRGALGNGEAARVGVYAVEAYGIFKIGEIIGRRSLIGYDL